MKNLKKLSRSGLKSINGGGFVSCPMPSGTPALCPGPTCPWDPCTAIPRCLRSTEDCHPPII